MDHFNYKNGDMFAEDVALRDIAQSVGTPFYCYSSATLVRHFQVFRDAFAGQRALVCFAVKANSNLAVLRTLANEGAGADVVSGGEMARALKAGMAPEKIVFSGVGKTADEMAAALQAGIHQFNVESEPELELLSAVAASMDIRARIAIRVNPDVDARTHEKISTGKKENKFGVAWGQARDIYARAARLPGVEVTGVDVHIGSQLTDLEPFAQAFAKVVDLVRSLRGDGHDIRTLDLGGGLGIPYDRGNAAPPHPAAYADVVRQAIQGIDCDIILEPGRLIAGNAGVLVSRVLYIKEGESRRFIIVDAAMNDLIRPSLYEAYHEIVPVRQAPVAAPREPVDVVGPVCETGDVFAKARALPPVAAGDLLAILSAGAYGAVMASTYNSRALVPEVMVDGSRFAVVRRRLEPAEIMDFDQLPPWL